MLACCAWAGTPQNSITHAANGAPIRTTVMKYLPDVGGDPTSRHREGTTPDVMTYSCDHASLMTRPRFRIFLSTVRPSPARARCLARPLGLPAWQYARARAGLLLHANAFHLAESRPCLRRGFRVPDRPRSA